MPRPLPAVLAALVCLIVLAAPAQAAYVDVVPNLASGPVPAHDAVMVSIDANEPTTTVTVERSGTTVTVTQTGAGVSLDASTDCTDNGLSVTCSALNQPRLVGMISGDPGDERTFTVADPIISQIFGGESDDLINGGPLQDTVRAGDGDDEVNGGDSPTDPDYLIGEDGNDTLDGQDGNDRFSGGRGGDLIRDTSFQETHDQVEYLSRTPFPDDFRTSQGVTVTMDGVANDGSPQDTATPGDGGFKDNVMPSVTSIDGTEHADTLTGGPGPNSISGFGGADTIVGLGGADVMHGHAGNDTLDARDGEADATINCNNSDASATEQPNTAIIDPGLESATNCSNVDGAPAAGGAGTGAGATPVLPGTPASPLAPFVARYPKPALKDVVRYPAKSVKMDDFARGTRLCGSKRWCRAAEIKARMESQQLNVDFEVKEATSKALETAVGRDVLPGEVLYTDPKKGETVTSAAKRAAEVRVYEFAPETIANNCNLERPYLRIRRKLFRLTDYLKGMTIDRAEDTLKDLGCKRSQWEIVDKVSTKVSDVTMTSVRVARKKVELTVTTPPPRLRLVDVKPPALFGKYIPPVFSSGGELSLPDQPFLMGIRVINDAGIGFKNLQVVLRDDDGTRIGGASTNDDGVAGLGTDKSLSTGTYELWAHACDPEGDCVVGTRKVKVIKLRKDRQYLGIDGRAYAASGEGFKARAAQASADVTRQKEDLGKVAAAIVTKVATTRLFREAQLRNPGGEVPKAVQVLNAAAAQSIKFGSGFAGYYDALRASGAEMNVLGGAGGVTEVGVGRLVPKVGVVSDGNRVGSINMNALDIGDGVLTMKVGNVMLLPQGMFYVVSGGAKAMGSPQKVKVDVASPKLDLVPMQGAMAVGLTGGPKLAGLVGMDGGTLVGMDGATLVGMDGGTLVGMDGGTLVGMDGGSVIARDGASLVGMDGGTLVGMDGGT